MLELLFLSPIAGVVLLVLVWRWFRRRVQEHALRSKPGLSPGRPIQGIPWNLRREYVDGYACPCGGTLKSYGEGPREEAGKKLHAVVAECEDCQRSYDFYFTEEVRATGTKEPELAEPKAEEPETCATPSNVVPFKRVR